MILSDKPIEESSEDKLNRIDFAKYLANGILNYSSKDSLCIALNGNWGSGKTSLINLCLNEINEKSKNLEKKPIILNFQPWLISNQEQLIKIFFDDLKKTLAKPNVSTIAKEAGKEIEKYQKALGYTTKITSFVPGIPQGITDTLKELGEWIERVSKGLKALEKEDEKDLYSIKKSTSSILENLESKIIIIIDNVDRLNEEEIINLFKLIKSVADFPNTIYLLSFELKYVQNVIKKYQVNGETNYLDKIIQLFFEIPSPEKNNIYNELWQGIEKIIETSDFNTEEKHRFDELKFELISPLFKNIRDVKRLHNILNFIYPMIKDEINPIDILIVETIHLFYPEIYFGIKESEEFILSDDLKLLWGSDISGDIERKNWVETNIINKIPDKNKQNINKLLLLLFPLLKHYIKENFNYYYSDNLTSLDKNKRICLKKYFECYFQYHVSSNEISFKDAKTLLNSLLVKNVITNELVNFIKIGKISKSISIFRDIIDNNKSDFLNSSNEFLIRLFKSFFEAGEEIRNLKVYSYTETFDITSFLYSLLKLLNDSETRKNVLIKSSKDLNSSLFILSLLFKTLIDKNEKEKILEENDLNLLIKEILDLINKNIYNIDFFGKPYFLDIVGLFIKIESIENVKTIINKIIDEKQNIPKFLFGCIDFIASSSSASYYTTHEPKINIKFMNKICNTSDLINASRSLLDENNDLLTDFDIKMLNFFLLKVKNEENEEDFSEDN